MEFKIFNNLEEYSEHLWFNSLRKITEKKIITIENMLLLRNIAIELKDKEKLKQLLNLCKMISVFRKW